MGGFISMLDLGEGLQDMCVLSMDPESSVLRGLTAHWWAAVYIRPTFSPFKLLCSLSLGLVPQGYIPPPVFYVNSVTDCIFCCSQEVKGSFFSISYIDLFLTLDLWTVSTKGHISFFTSFHWGVPSASWNKAVSPLGLSSLSVPLSAVHYELCSSRVF